MAGLAKFTGDQSKYLKLKTVCILAGSCFVCTEPLPVRIFWVSQNLSSFMFACSEIHGFPGLGGPGRPTVASKSKRVICIINTVLFFCSSSSWLRFGVENKNRTPPIEFRALLPELEANIEKHLDSLEFLGGTAQLNLEP